MAKVAAGPDPEGQGPAERAYSYNPRDARVGRAARNEKG
jgi:hypothetical protein